MFNLSILKTLSNDKDTVAVHPSSFGLPPEEAIIAELNKKYANRVLHDVGLCVTVFDLSEVGEGKVRYGDGHLWYKTVFRLIIFRPFTSEVIVGRVKTSDEQSIRVSVGFFDDIYIPSIYLPQPSCFDPDKRSHFWLPDSQLSDPQELMDTPTDGRLYIAQGAPIRLRVEADEFFDDEPGPPKAQNGIAVKTEAKRAPYSIIASIGEQGLGSISWWAPLEEEGDS
ncbi:hypothetical protein D9757_001661 [Collybiopsis confluens]|uniref:Uncharacterized protein n=1 Tax=Collybiopsis confluens TaxID=2823264 RepID=A0A8H5HYI1_9AGAR|nr:hypothetical protein D9757_001661 [Collybiopsis confluens]